MRPRLLQQILAAHARLSKGQRRAADYLYQNYDEAVFLTAGQIAERIGLSTSTVTRLAGALGYEGFPELQEAFRNLVRAERSTVSRPSSRRAVCPAGSFSNPLNMLSGSGTQRKVM